MGVAPVGGTSGVCDTMGGALVSGALRLLVIAIIQALQTAYLGFSP